MITYYSGDVIEEAIKFTEKESFNVIIPHICNDIGAWGAGFVLALSNQWPEPEEKYKIWRNSEINFGLGYCQLVRVTPLIQVCNMIAQKGIKSKGNPTPIHYEALSVCLSKLNNRIERNTVIMMPRIGCGLAGAKWEEVSKIIEEQLTTPKYIEVYTLAKESIF